MLSLASMTPAPTSFPPQVPSNHWSAQAIPGAVPLSLCSNLNPEAWNAPVPLRLENLTDEAFRTRSNPVNLTLADLVESPASSWRRNSYRASDMDRQWAEPLALAEQLPPPKNIVDVFAAYRKPLALEQLLQDDSFNPSAQKYVEAGRIVARSGREAAGTSPGLKSAVSTASTSCGSDRPEECSMLSLEEDNATADRTILPSEDNSFWSPGRSISPARGRRWKEEEKDRLREIAERSPPGFGSPIYPTQKASSNDNITTFLKAVGSPSSPIIRPDVATDGPLKRFGHDGFEPLHLSLFRDDDEMAFPEGLPSLLDMLNED